MNDKQHRLDKELRDLLQRNSVAEVLAALVRECEQANMPDVAEALRMIHDDLSDDGIG